MKQKIQLYINNEYICTSTRHSTCKDFKKKLIEDGFVMWRGLLREECYILKPADKLSLKIIK